MKLAKFIFIFSAVTFVLFACKGAGSDTAATDDTTGGGTTDGGGNTPPTTYTVTVNANGGKLGTWKSSTGLALDATVAKPNDADLPILTDNEIAYWSTSPDMYNTEFKFGETKVTSNITIYPHWRWTLDYIKKNMEGEWIELQTLSGGSEIKSSKLLYKVNYSNSYVYRCSSSTDIYDDNDPNNATNLAQLNKLKAIVVDPSRTPGPPTYTIGSNSFYFESIGNGASHYVYFLPLQADGNPPLAYATTYPFCGYTTLTQYSLSSYKLPNSDEISMNRFYLSTPVSGRDLILKNYSTLTTSNPQFTIYEETNGTTHRFVKK